jgi:cell filamentation protein
MVTGQHRAPVIDPYTYPGTNILVNKLDIRDAAELARVEADLTTLRIAELIGKLQQAVFDRAHLRAVHRHIFQDLYAWAGELRTVDIRDSGADWLAPALP